MAFESTRRRFIAGSLLLPLTRTVARADNELPSQLQKKEVAALLHRRDELLEQQRQLDERWKIANAQLPDWCKPGHKYRDIEGKDFGPLEGWPPLSDPIPIKGRGLLIRASTQDLRALFDENVLTRGRNEAVTSYRVSITDLRRRLSERRRIERTVGLPHTVDWLPMDEEIDTLEEALTERL